jgi:hypothetical protein
MSQIDREQIERSLQKKGFVKEETHHRYFYHEHNGKRTGAFTYTSHGSGYKTYGDTLLKRMKTELRLDTLQEVKKLLECPMDGVQYNEKLKSKGFVP